MPLNTLLKHSFSIVLLALATACSASPTVTLNGEKFTVEIADTGSEHAIGLMYRDKMPAKHGMLFLFDAEYPQAFWMKNTLIPLDILYFDEDFRFVSGSYDTPPCRESNETMCPAYPSDAPAKYVLELNAGVGKALNLKPGDQLVYNK
jgi:uncharacterized protein